MAKKPKVTDKKTYFITGGGTGGHIYPALAIANALKKDESTLDLYFIGKRGNLEEDLAKQNSLKFLSVNVDAMPRKLSLLFPIWLIKTAFSALIALFHINKYKPDAIFGTGGYVSAPALIAAIISKTPFMIHDCDANPGIVTRKFAPYAKIVSLMFEGAKTKVDSNNIVLNSNPMRDDFFNLDPTQAKEKMNLDSRLTLYSTGGSQGAHTINFAVVEAIKELVEELNLQVIIQTGSKKYNETIEKLKEIYPNYQEKGVIIEPYFDNTAIIMKASDIILSRAGSLSLSEICTSSLTPILVPYPHASANHQRKNAKYLEDKNACIYIEDDELNGERLLKVMKELVNNKELRESLKENANKLCGKNSIPDIINQIKSITK